MPILSLARHNDLPWQLLRRFNNQLRLPAANLTLLNDTHTNIPKLRHGHVGGQVGAPGRALGWTLGWAVGQAVGWAVPVLPC